MNPIKIYVAGKVAKESSFGTHHWREQFCNELENLSGERITLLDPTKSGIDQTKPEIVFGGDAYMIKKCDVLVVYLSDDISIGGSQEILIAKYFKKPVIGLAPEGGKFNGSPREFFGQKIESYRDPFVFTTCDIVSKNIDEVAKAIKNYKKIKPKSLSIIKDLSDKFALEQLDQHKYVSEATARK